MIYVVLIEPETAGNVGAVARVMSNFGFENLVLINPKCDYLSSEAIARSKHGSDILKKALIKDMQFLNELDVKIATSSKVGGPRNVFRTPVDVRNVGTLIPKDANLKIGLIFGRESIGLTNEELMLCDFLVSIPANKENKALNLSHAVAIVLYELFRSLNKESHIDHFELANKDEKRVLLELSSQILEHLEFNREQNKDTILLVLNRVITKSFLSKKEITTLLAFFRKILSKFKQ